MGRRPIPIEQRFWQKVDVRGPGECWNWRGVVSKVGYGFIWYNGGQSYAHRWAYRLSAGTEIATGMQVCHRCDNKLCCNPAHLFLGTISDNMRDKVQKQRQARGEGHGHARLTGFDIEQIRALVASGRKQQEVADMFAVDQSHVSRICAGEVRKAG